MCRNRNLEWLIAGVQLLACSVWSSESTWAVRPKVSKQGNDTKIEFALVRASDVEVAVLSAKGEVVRHLAAGVLGGTNAPPEPLKAGLAQSLAWDGKDDAGNLAQGGPFQFRVRAGMGVKFGRALADSPYFIGTVQGLAGGEDGNLYVFHQTLGSGPQSVQVFDEHGQYVRTPFPFPDNLPREKLGDMIYWDDNEKRMMPRNYHDTYPRQIPYFYKAGESVHMLPAVTREGGILLAASQWLFRLDTDGSTGGRPLRFGRFFPFSLSAYDAACQSIFSAVSPDGRTLYATGPCSKLAADGKPYNENWPAGQIFSMPLDKDAYLKPFVRLDEPANWPTLVDDPPVAGLAVDKQGRIYVCDRAHGRLAIVDAQGKAAGFVPAAHPFRVSVETETGSIYVLGREDSAHEEMTKKGKVIRHSYHYRLSHVAGLQAEHAASELDLGVSDNANGWLALTVKDGRTGVWLASLKHSNQRGDLYRADVTRYEEKDGTFVATAALHEQDAGALGAHDTLAVDPATEEVYVNDDYSGMYRYNGITGEGGSLQKVRQDFYSTEVAVGRDALLYARTGPSYSGPLERLTRELKPAPLASGSHVFTDYIYSRYGAGHAEKGVAVGPQGQVYVMNMYGWQRYAVYGLTSTGPFMEGNFLKGKLSAYAESKGPRPNSAIIGPLPDTCGGLRVDSRGNIYVGMLMLPPGFEGPAVLSGASSWRSLVGSIAKFGPDGGEWICTDPRLAGRAAPEIRRAVPEGAPGIWMERGHFLHGALTVYPGFAPFSGSAGTSETGRPPMGRENCACRSPRFDLDRFDRLYIPNAVTGRVRVVDNSGNEILVFGDYGNRDSAGENSAIAVPRIPLAWPIGVGVSEERIYVCDQLNRRVVRADKTWTIENRIPMDDASKATEEVGPIPVPAERKDALQQSVTVAPERKDELLPRARVPLAAAAPELDGKLDDECWKTATKLTDFRPNTGGPNRAGFRTETFMTTTKDTLYLALRCQEKDLQGLLGKREQYSWEDDGLEIFIQAGNRTEDPYHHIQVNAFGALNVEYNRMELPSPQAVKAVSGREKEAWTLEMAIPFSSLTLPKDEKTLAGPWRFNIIRVRQMHQGDKKPGGAIKVTAQGEAYNEESAWSPTECESCHMPHMFGYLVLEAFEGKKQTE